MKLELRQFETLPSPDITCMGCSRDMESGHYGEGSSKTYTICYVTAGRVRYNGNCACEGQGFLIYPDMIEDYWIDEGEKTAFLWVSSNDERMKALFETYHADPETLIFDYRYVPAVKGAFERLVLLHNYDAGYFDVYSVFTDIMQAHFACIKEEKERNPSEVYLRYAIQYIRYNYASEIRIGELTEQIGISQPHLYNIFQTHLGVSPKEYISRFRTEQAIKLLLGTNLTVAEVGKAVGYGDPMAFSRFFSAQQGISPSKFRKAHQIRISREST